MATTQRERHAAGRARKIDARREDATGAAGWIAERAGDWSLEGADDTFMERQKYLWNPLMDYWFRMEIEGWEQLPEPPALLIGIHSGAPFVWDAWTVGVQWWRHFGDERPLHGTAHDALMAAPVIGALLPQDGRPARRARLDRRGARRRAATWRCGRAARSTRCGRGPSATRPCSPGARASSGWRSAPACRSCRSRPSAAPTRCRCCSAAGGSRRRCSSTRSRA